MRLIDKDALLRIIEDMPTVIDVDPPKKGAWVYRSDDYFAWDGVIKLTNGNPRYKDYKVMAILRGVATGFWSPSGDMIIDRSKEVVKWIFNPKRNEVYIDPSENCSTVRILYKVYDTEATVAEVKCDG